MVGKTISHYRIVSQLGAGGMGVVYAAEDVRLGRSVALKFLPEDLARDDQALKRLRSEARTASALSHANICTIYDIDEGDGRSFIVMELLRGQDLRERLSARSLKVHEVVDIGIQVADALDCAHSRGVIHRDIKPTNLFLVDRGQIKIVDFGLAKQFARHHASLSTRVATADLTTSGTTLGTVSYMSPEQVTGEELDGRTDIFSFGVVLYECVTGHQPFAGKTAGVVMSAILNKAPVAPVVFNPELPLRMQEVINNCLEKDRELRYQSAGDLRADLKRIKRDLESGHSPVMRTAGALVTATSAATTSAEVRTTANVDSAQWARTTAGGIRGSRFRLAVAGSIGIAIMLAASGVYFSRRAPESTRAPVSGVSETLVRRTLESAAANLRTKNYRAALSQSEEVLQSAPNQAEAIQIRDEAKSTMARFDQAIARATTLLAAGNPEAATEAIDAARSIDPAAPVVSELSARLISEFRSRAEAARKPSPSQPAPTGNNLSARQAVNDPARRESQRSVTLPESPESIAQPSRPTSSASAPATSTPPSASGTLPLTTPPVAPSPSTVPAQAGQPQTSPKRDSDAAATASDAPRDTASPPPANEDDDTAIRDVVATYARAIETKDLSLFRSIKPNLSPQEQRKIEEGFRAVSSQRVRITILAIDRRGQEASVRLTRTDTIAAGGRQQTVETQQTMTLMRSGPGWVIREIGR